MWASLAQDGDAAAPVLRALRERVAPQAADVQAALVQAIRVFSPEAVQALIDMGADVQARSPLDGVARTPLAQAQTLYAPQPVCLNTGQLQARKARIVAMLQAAGG